MPATLEPVAPPADLEMLRALEPGLAAALIGAQQRPVLRAPDGTEFELPEALFRVLYQAARILLNGDRVSIVPVHAELTSQEAADFLNISRPFLVRLLDEGKIPFTKVGRHRRIRFGDVMNYRRERATHRRERLNELMAISEAEYLYS